jgi:hypothetical protein
MSDWTRLNFIVEGQTEETFVNRMITSHLATYSINVSVRCVTTGRKQGHVFRGGMPIAFQKKKHFQTCHPDDRRALKIPPIVGMTGL